MKTVSFEWPSCPECGSTRVECRIDGEGKEFYGFCQECWSCGKTNKDALEALRLFGRGEMEAWD